MAITEIGLADLMHRINERKIVLPKEMAPAELRMWLLGYTQAQKDFVDIIKEMRGDQE